MHSGRPYTSGWLRWTLLFGFWTLLGMSFAGQFYISSFKAGVSISWGRAVSWALGDWYVFAVLSLPVFRLARRFPIAPENWRKRVAGHLAGSIFFSLAYILVRAAVGVGQGMLGGESISFAEAFQPLLVKTWHFNLLIYWVMLSVCQALEHQRKLQERELASAEMEKRLAEARLRALQMQLNPHFLFNTLHGISALMHRDVEAADQMITRLSDLLRYALESTDEREVPLERELDFLRRYLEIEQIRFGSRLRIEFDIDPLTLRARVPNLILQPLLENAVRHGIEPHAKTGQIRLCSAREGDVLCLEVRDNGAGMNDVMAPEGIGVSNTRARLLQLYGGEHSFELQNLTEGGLMARIKIPFRKK